MKKNILLLLVIVLSLVALFGCGGGGPGFVGGPVDYSGAWSGPFSGDLNGTITADIEVSGTMDITGTIDGLGAFSGDGWINPETGDISGKLGSLGKIVGKARLSGGTLVGEVNLPGSKKIMFQLKAK